MIPHHVVTGPEDAPALVLANSLGTTLAMWDAQVAALAERFRLIRYDTRGHGGSAAPPGPYSIDDAGRDVVELLDALDVEQAHVAGVSLGGMTALWLAINAPGRVHRLVPICTSAKLGPPESWAERSALVRAQGTEAIVDATMERWFTADHRAADDLAAMRAMFTGTDDEGYASCCSIIEHMDLTPGLKGITAPTLVIAAAQDPSTPPDPHATTIADAIADARLEVLDPGAHLVAVERPQAVADLILEHLEA
ncbi:MAG TPA: 3-oxoadipate enol-lactonase [Solirubrobacter sp.]|nr:3-oxoadipate enol-lactonase [Solirubrobacter sp.]